MFKKIALSLCFSLFLGLLSSCSPNGIAHFKNAESNTEKNAELSQENTSKQENTSQKTASDSVIGAPVALPPSFGNEPPKPGETNTAYMPNGLPALQPLKGVNLDTLFSDELKNSDERFDRLENAVLDMRKEFESVKPSIVRMAAVEADIQSLMKELEVMLQETPPEQNVSPLTERDATLQVEQIDPQPQAPPIPLEPEKQELATPPPAHTLKLPPNKTVPAESQVPVPAPAQHPTTKAEQVLAEPPKPIKPLTTPSVPQPSYDGVIAQNIRIGEHADKIRIVLDTNQKTPFSIDLDNDEKLIIVELPEARWVGESEHIYTDTTVLESYTTEPLNGGKGTMLVFTLKKSTQILKESTLLPDANPSHRIYFDLKP